MKVIKITADNKPVIMEDCQDVLAEYASAFGIKLSDEVKMLNRLLDEAAGAEYDVYYAHHYPDDGEGVKGEFIQILPIAYFEAHYNFGADDGTWMTASPKIKS